ncbi:MAG: hypothetical protein OXE42_01325 [Gammaproteobacteria bacterium]|nr:hypothetical protein [Gammaproteobacteria bacterium]
MTFRHRPGDRKPLDPQPDKPRGGGVEYRSAAELRDKRRASPELERLARALERGFCE